MCISFHKSKICGDFRKYKAVQGAEQPCALIRGFELDLFHHKGICVGIVLKEADEIASVPDQNNLPLLSAQAVTHGFIPALKCACRVNGSHIVCKDPKKFRSHSGKLRFVQIGKYRHNFHLR